MGSSLRTCPAKLEYRPLARVSRSSRSLMAPTMMSLAQRQLTNILATVQRWALWLDTYAHYECPDGYECGDINGDKEQIKCMPAESSGASATFAVTSVVAASTVLAMLAPAFA